MNRREACRVTVSSPPPVGCDQPEQVDVCIGAPEPAQRREALDRVRVQPCLPLGVRSGAAAAPFTKRNARPTLVTCPASTICERFTVGTVTHLPKSGGAPVVERAVLAAPGQLVELLPGWQPLAS
jgi:hypothetical protein